MDAAASGTFSIVDGTADTNSGGLHALQDGLTPLEADQPSLNFFFAAGPGGRLKLDLGHPVDIQAINSYSRHAQERGPQVYALYASEGPAPGFNPEPKLPTETRNNVGNTFYSEIDVVETGKSLADEPPPPGVKSYPIAGGRYSFVLTGAAAADAGNAHYDGGYRVTANFLNWVTQQTRPGFVPDLNSQIRQGHYDDRLRQQLAGEPLPELGARWKQSLSAGRAQ